MDNTEYISKEAALACFSDWIDRYGHEHSADEMAEYQRIEDLLPADVVEVVRCRDCRYYPIEGTGGFDLKWPIDGYNCPFCADDEYYSAKPEKDGFCSRGERRTDP